jgi:hypothetical protein
MPKLQNMSQIRASKHGYHRVRTNMDVSIVIFKGTLDVIMLGNTDPLTYLWS